MSDCIQAIRDVIGPVAAFKSAGVVGALPKTRSGKILRGVIQKIANGSEYKLPGTIEDGTIGVLVGCTERLAKLGYPKFEDA